MRPDIIRKARAVLELVDADQQRWEDRADFTKNPALIAVGTSASTNRKHIATIDELLCVVTTHRPNNADLSAVRDALTQLRDEIASNSPHARARWTATLTEALAQLEEK